MTTLAQLIAEYGANAYGYEDAGNGSSNPGRLLLYEDDDATSYGDTPMTKLDTPGLLDDGTTVEYASEWIVSGSGDNPYRYRIFF